MNTIYTVVAWNKGDERVRAVGPTSEQPDLPRSTRDRARELHAGAEVVPWSQRTALVSKVRDDAERARREREADAAAMDAFEGARR